MKKQKTLFGAALLLMFTACQKGVETESPKAKQEFTAADAKEWYYGTFKKSTDWQQSKQRGQKLPNWKVSASKVVNGASYVEFPLVNTSSSFPISSLQREKQLTRDEMTRTASAAISKVLFIKKPNGEISLQEVYLIPDYSYLERKRFDISAISSFNYRDFTGVLFKKNWNGEEITAWRVENGTATRKGKVKSSNLSKPNMTETINCYSQQFCVWQQDCEANFYPDGLVTVECGEWYNTGDCWTQEWCIGDDPCEENPEACNGGGGGDDPPPCTQQQADEFISSLSTSSLSTKNGIEPISTSPTLIKKRYIWDFAAIVPGVGSGITFTSKEIGTQTLGADGRWRFNTFEHEGTSRRGFALLWNAEVSSLTKTPTIADVETGTPPLSVLLSFAKMKLDWEIHIEYSCGVVIAHGYPNGTSENIWYQYEQ